MLTICQLETLAALSLFHNNYIQTDVFCPDVWVQQHVMCVSLLEDHSLVVVERPLLDMMSQLPAPVRQKKFAT